MHPSAFCPCCRAVDTAARHHSSSHSRLLSLSPSQDLRLVQSMGILDAVCRLVGFGPFPQLLGDSTPQPPHKPDSAAALYSMRGSPGWHHLSNVRHTSSADSSCHDCGYHCLPDTVCPANKEGLHSSWRVSGSGQQQALIDARITAAPDSAQRCAFPCTLLTVMAGHFVSWVKVTTLTTSAYTAVGNGLWFVCVVCLYVCSTCAVLLTVPLPVAAVAAGSCSLCCLPS